MEQINDGGPAFPHSRLGSDHDGMTLRDYFAAKAMQGWFASPYSDEVISEDETIEDVRKSHCENFYKWADAMLAEREK